MIRAFRSLSDDRSGAFAVEFALIAPVLLVIVFGSIGLGLSFWMKNVLQDAAVETARCLAIGSPLCQSTTCGAGSGGACYAIAMAASRGVANVTSAEVTLSPSVTYMGQSFTSVAIAHSFTIAGYSFVLTGKGMFPNNQ